MKLLLGYVCKLKYRVANGASKCTIVLKTLARATRNSHAQKYSPIAIHYRMSRRVVCMIVDSQTGIDIHGAAPGAVDVRGGGRPPHGRRDGGEDPKLVQESAVFGEKEERQGSTEELLMSDGEREGPSEEVLMSDGSDPSAVVAHTLWNPQRRKWNL